MSTTVATRYAKRAASSGVRKFGGVRTQRAGTR
jgi:hypothetical protein